MQKIWPVAARTFYSLFKKHPAGVLPVVGTTDTERLAELNKGASVDLALEDWFILLEASQGRRVP